jgi:hypothetical protein
MNKKVAYIQESVTKENLMKIRYEELCLLGYNAV